MVIVIFLVANLRKITLPPFRIIIPYLKIPKCLTKLDDTENIGGDKQSCSGSTVGRGPWSALSCAKSTLGLGVNVAAHMSCGEGHELSEELT